MGRSMCESDEVRFSGGGDACLQPRKVGDLETGILRGRGFKFLPCPIEALD